MLDPNSGDYEKIELALSVLDEQGYSEFKIYN